MDTASLQMSWKRMVDRYRSPYEGRIQTTRLPKFSAREATWNAAVTAAPEEMPQNIPSSMASRLAIRIASSEETVIVSSTSSVDKFLGTKPAPIPWILCGPGLPPEMTGDSVGSTAITLSSGFSGRRYWAHPVSVPPVPTPETRKSILPPVSLQISGPVVSLTRCQERSFIKSVTRETGSGRKINQVKPNQRTK